MDLVNAFFPNAQRQMVVVDYRRVSAFSYGQRTGIIVPIQLSFFTISIFQSSIMNMAPRLLIVFS